MSIESRTQVNVVRFPSINESNEHFDEAIDRANADTFSSRPSPIIEYERSQVLAAIDRCTGMEQNAPPQGPLYNPMDLLRERKAVHTTLGQTPYGSIVAIGHDEIVPDTRLYMANSSEILPLIATDGQNLTAQSWQQSAQNIASIGKPISSENSEAVTIVGAMTVDMAKRQVEQRSQQREIADGGTRYMQQYQEFWGQQSA